jgi:hypothetical protein
VKAGFAFNVEVHMNMNQVYRYPKFNEHPYNQRPILAMYGDTPLGELIWLAFPLLVIVLAVIFR